MSIKQQRELLACRICLATDTELYNIQDVKLVETFVNLMDSEVCALRHVCGVCRAQLARAAALCARARHAQALLNAALKHTHYITLDYIRTIDRVAEKLCLNLKTCHVYSSDSTLQEVKLEDVKEETDFTEHIFVSEPSVIDYDEDFIENTPEFENESINESITNQENTKSSSNEEIEYSKIYNKLSDSGRTKRKLPKSTKGNKRKLPESTRDSENKPIESAKVDKKKLESTKETKVLPDSTKTKRVIKRRMADNGFLPDFNFKEFESKYNVRIDILSKEEQIREIEARKMAASYTLSAFGCDVCGKGFATKQVYDAHMIKHDVSAGAHACGVCGVRFRTRSRAHVHADAHRLRFTCNKCGFLTRTRFIAKNHFLSHAGTTHQCPHCDAAFTKYTSYLTHVRRRHPAMNVACDECGETFVGPNGLRHHKTRVHRDKMQNPRATAGPPCPDCGLTFVDQASYDTHYQRIHLNIRMKEPPRARARNGRAFICELCGAECASGWRLAAHQRAHVAGAGAGADGGARPHPCPAGGCARRFATLHNMQRHHRVVHLGNRPAVACGVCGKLLAHAASLKLHVNTVHLKLPAPRRRRDKRPETNIP